MKKYLLLISALTGFLSSYCQTDTLLHSYNSKIYTSVKQAAIGVATPFLLQQKYLAMASVTVKDSTLIQKSISYHVHDYYMNPATGYYILPAAYNTYGISIFSAIWPKQFPNVVFNGADTTFISQSDCVGYLTRLLSATGDTTATGNGYWNLINTTHAANVAPFAAKGYVATAYSFAVAFPTLPASVSQGWQYISGNVESSEINTYNHSLVSTIGTYNGVRKGGFGQSQPGDVLAFGYSPSSSSNGHIMVMDTIPRLLTSVNLKEYFPSQSIAAATNLMATFNIYSVKVFDCSGKKAHFADSRTQMSGIGHGTLLILTAKSDDAPEGFIFDTTQVTYNPPHMDTLGTSTSVYAISVGRFIVSLPTGIAVPDNKQSSIQVYPNPSNNELHIQLPAHTTGLITIYNINGQIVFQQKVETALLMPDISKWQSGLYIIQYIQADGSYAIVKWLKL